VIWLLLAQNILLCKILCRIGTLDLPWRNYHADLSDLSGVPRARGIVSHGAFVFLRLWLWEEALGTFYGFPVLAKGEGARELFVGLRGQILSRWGMYLNRRVIFYRWKIYTRSIDNPRRIAWVRIVIANFCQADFEWFILILHELWQVIGIAFLVGKCHLFHNVIEWLGYLILHISMLLKVNFLLPWTR